MTWDETCTKDTALISRPEGLPMCGRAVDYEERPSPVNKRERLEKVHSNNT